jgi:hypothetical protein
MTTVPPDRLAALRHRLHEMRAELVAQLAQADTIEPSWLAMLAHTEIVLSAIDPSANSALASNAMSPAQRHRGGDHQHASRADRNAAIREYASLLGADLSLEETAAAIISKADRYRPMPGDDACSGERQALHRIAASGLRVPKTTRQVRRIIAGEV